jgi:hypothetical protein
MTTTTTTTATADITAKIEFLEMVLTQWAQTGWVKRANEKAIEALPRLAYQDWHTCCRPAKLIEWRRKLANDWPVLEAMKAYEEAR